MQGCMVGKLEKLEKSGCLSITTGLDDLWSNSWRTNANKPSTACKFFIASQLFWTTEAMGVDPNTCSSKLERLTPTELEEVKIIEESCTKIGNQWIIPYPWQKDPNLLPDYKKQAERKLEATECRLMKNPDHASAYEK